MQKFPDGWNLKDKIEFLQRKIILNSVAYYEYDTNFLSDKFYDSMCKQLVELQHEYGDVSDTQYGYAFCDFDGSTGFDLYFRLTEKDRDYLLNILKHQIYGGSRNARKK